MPDPLRSVEDESVRARHLDRLRGQVAAGTYRVPAEVVADAILRFFARERD